MVGWLPRAVDVRARDVDLVLVAMASTVLAGSVRAPERHRIRWVST